MVWADFLHYIRSGQFVLNLIKLSAGNDNLRAYALGYLTHYVTDVVGHPYVNQVVGAPWRLAWQRHHLVENFIDTYVWDRWHAPLPPPAPPSSQEQPLDRVLSTPNAIGGGAPYTFSRINDWINIGSLGGIDPVDMIVNDVATEIEKKLFDIGAVDEIDPAAPTNADFGAWCKLFVTALHATYNEDQILRPMNLASGILPGGVKRADGFPTAEDVAAAYGVFRLAMRVGTEEKIAPPQPPNIAGDVTAAVQQVLNQVTSDLAGIPAPQPMPSGASFSPDAILAALIAAAEWAGAVAEAVTKAVTDFLNGVVTTTNTVVSNSIKYVLYLLNSALFALYRTFRDVLVLQAYSPPYTEQLTQMFGVLSASNVVALDRQRRCRCLSARGIADPTPVFPQQFQSNGHAERSSRNPDGRFRRPLWPCAFSARLHTGAPRRVHRRRCWPERHVRPRSAAPGGNHRRCGELRRRHAQLWWRDRKFEARHQPCHRRFPWRQDVA